MKGTVEVIAIVDDGREEVLYREDNLVVNEASRTIVDMLTTPSSTLSYAPRVMDTSNWVVQAISFGKDPSAYSDNAHRMPERRNMLTYSTPSATTGLKNWSFDGILTSRPDLSPPPAYSHIPSSIGHVITAQDTNTTRNVRFNYLDWFNYGWTRNWTVGAFNNMWITASVYIKHPFGETTGPSPTLGTPRTMLVMSVKGKQAPGFGTGGSSGVAQVETDIDWDADSGWTTPSSIYLVHQSYNGTHNVNRMVSAGYSEFWQQNGGCNDEGDGWYRIWTTALAPSVETSAISFNLYPARYVVAGKSLAGLQVYGFQLEPGRWPTDLQFNNGVSANNWDWSGSVMGSDLRQDPTLSGIGGTIRVSGSVGVSSYTPTNSLNRYPDPLDKKLARTSLGDFAASTSVLSGFDMGQNLNTVAYRRTDASDDGTAGPFMTASGNMTNWQEQMAWRHNAYWQGPEKTTLSGFDTLGPQAFFQGCYAEGSSTGGTRFAIVSSLDNIEAYGASGENAVAVGIYNGGFNEASTMDLSGFVGKVYDPHNNTVGILPNPNLLSYTPNPQAAPGGYWSRSTGIGGFSSIEGTDVFGHTASDAVIELSAGIDSTYWVSFGSLATSDASPSGLPRNWKSDKRTATTVYVKRPTQIGAFLPASGFVIANYDVSLPNKINNTIYFEYLNGYDHASSGVPTVIAATVHAIEGSILEDAGNGWYRCGIVTSGLGAGGPGGTGATVDGDYMRNYFYIGGDSFSTGGDMYPQDGTTGKWPSLNNANLWFCAPQCEQHDLTSDVSATPYQAVKALSPLASENNGVYGLTVSSLAYDTSTFADNGVVTYECTISSGDCGMAQLYGGIYNIGLWTIDMKESLKYAQPPFEFNPLSNLRKYRFFSSKKFIGNLTSVNDYTSEGPAIIYPGVLAYKDLKIRWTLDFRATGYA